VRRALSGAMAAWSPGDAFASDLIRDLALTRLLITEGWGILDEAVDPRRALRAARLACQSRLNAAGGDFLRAGASLRSEFEHVATRHGERWAEIPLEAMLTLTAARQALAEVWSKLATHRYKGLGTVARLALQRYVRGGVGDPIVLAPLVELAFCGADDPGLRIGMGRAAFAARFRSWCWPGVGEGWSMGLLPPATGAPQRFNEPTNDGVASTPLRTRAPDSPGSR
jgi:hypothetical protein